MLKKEEKFKTRNSTNIYIYDMDKNTSSTPSFEHQ